MLSFSATACLLYLIKSVLSRTFFIFETFSFNRFCPICYLKCDNSDILSCVVLFVNNFFVVRCQIMSCPAVSLTMLPSGYYFVNPFFPKISLSYVYFRKVNFTVSVHLSRKDIFPPYFISISLWHRSTVLHGIQADLWQNAFIKSKFFCFCHALLCHTDGTHFSA